MTEKTVVTVKISPELKDEWRDYAEETPEVDSVSHLIRLSVNKEMAGRSSQTVDQDNSEVLEALQSIQNSIDSIETRLTRIESEDSAEGPGYDLQHAVFEALPEGSLDPADSPNEFGITIEQIAEKLAQDEDDVRSAVIALSQNVSQVAQATGGPDSKTYYWVRS